MWETIKKQWTAKVAVFIFVFFTSWWVIDQFMNLPHDSNINQWFGGTYGVVALWGGVCGIFISRKWGGFQSIMGKSILFFALGLLDQEIGQIAYTYYISFLHQPIPYPSIGDFFFWSTLVFYALGVIYLSKASGVHISLRSGRGKIQAVVIPTIILLLCYIVFLQGYKFVWSDPVKIAIDLGVPIGEAIYISLAIITYTLTRGVLGGVMKSKVLFILIALLGEYAADWVFLYQASRNTWYTGGINDYMYFFAYFLMAFGILQFDTVLRKIRSKENIND